MKELSDEDIQELLAAGSRIDPTPEVELYEAIFKELSAKPALNTNSLSSDVIKEIQYKLEWQSRIKFWIVSAIILISGSAVFILVAGSVDQSLVKQILVHLDNYKWVCLFIILMCAAAEIIDKALLISRQKI